MKKLYLFFLGIVVLTFLSTSLQSIRSSEEKTLTVLTYAIFNVSHDVIKQFEKKHNVKIQFLRTIGANSSLNQAILNDSIADVFFWISSTNIKKALKANIFKPYKSPLLAKIPDSLKLDPKNRLLPAAFGEICLNYDINWFEKRNMKPPSSLEDLIKPKYKSLTIISNPANSITGLNFLLLTISHFGEDKYLDFWDQLRKNDVAMTNFWTDAYNHQFTAIADSGRPIVISYGGMHVREILKRQKASGNTNNVHISSVVSKNAGFREIVFVGILKGTKQLKLAKKFVDFVLSKTYQEDIPLNLFMFPANREAQVPQIFSKNTARESDSKYKHQDEITKRSRYWIEKWTETVIK